MTGSCDDSLYLIWCHILCFINDQICLCNGTSADKIECFCTDDPSFKYFRYLVCQFVLIFIPFTLIRIQDLFQIIDDWSHKRKEEVIQKTLLKELKAAPDLFILSASELAGGWAGDAKYPVMAVQKSQESPLAKVGDVFRAGPRDLLIQLAEGAAPLRVMFATSVDAAAQEQAVPKLLEAGYHMDLVEPLERVGAALQSLVVKGS